MKVTFEIEAKDEVEHGGKTCFAMSDAVLDVLSELRGLRRKGLVVDVVPSADDPASPGLVEHLGYLSK